MARRRHSRSQLVSIKGTVNLKITKNIATKIQKGTITPVNLAKNLARTNAQHMAKYFRNAETEFTRLARNSQDLQSTIENIKTAYRSQLFRTGKGLLLADSMTDMIEKKFSTEEIEVLKADLNITELDFTGWTWNKDKQRLEDPTHKYYISIEGHASDDEYTGMSIDYGTL